MNRAEYAAYLNSEGWQEKRRMVFETCDECAKCGLPRWLAGIAYGQDINIHHKTYARVGSEELSDLQALCARCHEIERFGRSDLRAPKESTCEFCKQKHWNPRSALCEFCLRIFGTEEGPMGWALLFEQGATDKPELCAKMMALARNVAR